MIEVSNKQDGKLVHLKYKGIVTHEDYKKVLIPKLKKAIKTSAPLRLCCDLRDCKKIEGKAMWDDYKFGINHIKDFERVATIGDQWWMPPLIKVSSLFFRNIKLKHFKSKQYKEAQKWLDKKH